MSKDVLHTMMKSIFTSVSKRKGEIEVELKCGSYVKGTLKSIDSQLNMIMENVKYKMNNSGHKEFGQLLIRASSVKYIYFSKSVVNPQSIQSAWFSLAK